MAVKAVACELPRTLELPLSRLFVPDIQKEVIRQGIVASISGSTGEMTAPLARVLPARASTLPCTTTTLSGSKSKRACSNTRGNNTMSTAPVRSSRVA